MKRIHIFPVLILGLLVQNAHGKRNIGYEDKLILSNGWYLQSSALVNDEGESISRNAYPMDGWYPVTVPTTVLNGLIKNEVYLDPHLDMNNFLIPDMSDEFNEKYDLVKYSYLPDLANPWKEPYWFRATFMIPKGKRGKRIWLNFKGINYRADVWLNGEQVAGSHEMAGMFQRFKYDITDLINVRNDNYLAVKIYPVDHPGVPGTQLVVFGDTRGHADDLFRDVTLKFSGGWDCAPVARDRNMGIYQDVYLSFTDQVDIRNPYIVTDLLLPDTTKAALTISADLVNIGNKTVTGVLKERIEYQKEIDFVTYTKQMQHDVPVIEFEKRVTIPAGETQTVTMDSKDIPELLIDNPLLWWPNGYGEQNLYNLELSFAIEGKASSKEKLTFGIREVSNELVQRDGGCGEIGDYGRQFFINGRRVYCKGGWLQPDILLDMNKERIYKEARLLAEANVNMVANEDMPSPSEDFMDACDKYGLMLWEVFYQCWTAVPGTETAHYPLDHYLAGKNMRDVIKRYRNNACLVMWCAAVEVTVDEDLYLTLRDDIKRLDKTRPFIPASSIWWDWKKLTPYIKDELPLGMTDHYDPDYTWKPPSFFFEKVLEVKWQLFRNELGVPSVPTLTTLEKSIFNLGENKDNSLFPLDSVWAHHGAWDGPGYAFRAYHNAIVNDYGFNTTNIEDYAYLAQLVNYDAYRAMFEAYAHRMWAITNGVMLWKLNSCWPTVLWQIYDWYLNPNAAYYATRKACEPLHIQMNANDFQVSVINTHHKSRDHLTASAKVYDFDLNLRWEGKETVNIGADRYQEIFRVPRLSDLTPVYFVKLELKDKQDRTLSTNFYWESSQEPIDFSDLMELDEVELDVEYTITEVGKEYVIDVTLENTTDRLSFFNRLAITQGEDGEEVLPTYWEDNYLTLFPGETRKVKATVAVCDVGLGVKPNINISKGR